MQIIKGIKIRNFRSFTGIKSEVVNLKDFNIFSGSNDSGKSNIFRALNLFFNNEITHGVPFDMERDFSEQKKTGKTGNHRVVEIRLDFELTTEGTKYLSKNFAIEKTYYRDNTFDYNFIYKKNPGEEIKISSNPDKNKDIRDSSKKIIISTNPNKIQGIDDEKQFRKQFNEFLGKVHIGVDVDSGLVHSATITKASVHDKTERDNLLHGKEKAIFGDKAYGDKQTKKEWRKKGIYYGISDKGSKNVKLSNNQKDKNRKKSGIRSKVEHIFRVVKCQFGFTKFRYKGIEKNTLNVKMKLALANLYLVRKVLLATG